jgi:hypothetical protein
MSVTALEVQRVGAGAGQLAACQVVADAINAGAITAVTAPAVLTGSTLSIRAATNAVSGSASAAQITALEGLQKGLPTIETKTSGAISVSTAITFLEPTTPTTFTFAAGTKGQTKLIMLNTANAATLPGPVVLTAIGDNLSLLYNGSGWQVIASTITP